MVPGIFKFGGNFDDILYERYKDYPLKSNTQKTKRTNTLDTSLKAVDDKTKNAGAAIRGATGATPGLIDRIAKQRLLMNKTNKG